MLFLEGRVESGVGHFRQRMTNFPHVFKKATGESLIPGTLNVKVSAPVPIKEHFRIIGAEIDEPEQDLLFEVCRINGIWAYRIRPYHLLTGSGGHGDETLEISSSERIPNARHGSLVKLALFRDR
jgi:CTP-dependent riboflavin kinase